VTYVLLIDSLLGAVSSVVAIAEFLRKRRGRENGGAVTGDQPEMADHRDGASDADQGT
jgi:hypothetical protein